ncbi:unnamed protein product [Brachionus calyciflorus]|uniref:C-type lectin domain-containing protein n=1 Tax=Brachionus calyciflorus TaxID=104777 RepID=A0A814EH88_9BILA|nr:unnamed protein product [Brachionus calyciflorus]
MDVSYDTFLVMNYIILNNESLTVKLKAVSKFSCLQKCTLELNCMYAFYERYECLLYAFSDTYNLTSSNNSQIYAKKNRITEELNEIILEGPDSKVCNMSSEFWSLKKNSCEPCKPEFVKYSEMPFLCYHHTGGQTFAQSKSYCESKGAVLFRPKTKKERDFFPKKFPIKRAYVDSMITKLGEKFKWPDGTTVIGFSINEPNNFGSQFLSLYENCLIIDSNGFFNDVAGNRIFDLTICQHD